MPIRNEEETVFLYLWPFGSFPETRRVIGEALVTMFPSLMLGHMIFAESLAAILTLLVLLRYTSAFVTFFQVKPTSNRNNTGDNRVGFKLEPGPGLLLGCDSTLRSVLAKVLHDRW